jgi:hypothetical protein
MDFITSHQAVCAYAAYRCPFIYDKKCTWRGVRLKMHLLPCHIEDMREENGVTDLTINIDNTELKGCELILACDEIFFIHIQRKEPG